ncbi:MAG: Xanthan lyase [Verrucomicrobiales bacterium]|nr:Xanthan lyase [Verrucomicrobiales bacterium]
MKKTLLFGLVLMSPVAAARAAVVFSDDFESGTLANWTSTAATPSPLTISTSQNVVPVVGTYSAAVDNTTDRMHHNIIDDNGGSEVEGASIFSYYFYDDGGSTREFAEVRGYSGGAGLPNGGTAATGALAQLLAIGRYNSVTLAGETFNATKYQARLTFGTSAGWFNLDGVGTPSRSIGWHQFGIERLADGTSINFYVDGILSRSLAGATAASWDTIVLGSALGATATTAYFDGVSLVTVPEPSGSVLTLAAILGAASLRRRKA